MQRRVTLMRPRTAVIGSSVLTTSTAALQEQQRLRTEEVRVLAMQGLLVPKSRHEMKLVKRYGDFTPGPKLRKKAQEKIDKLRAMEAEAKAIEAEGQEEDDSAAAAAKKGPVRTTLEKEIALKKASKYGMTLAEYDAHMASLKPEVIKMYPGDWFCTTCNKLNTRIDLECRKCYTPKGFLSNSKAGSGNGGAKEWEFGPDRTRDVEMWYRNEEGRAFRRDDWRCANEACKANNRKTEKACFKCGTEKQVGYVAGDWMCLTCETPNHSTKAMKCFKCGTPKLKSMKKVFNPVGFVPHGLVKVPKAVSQLKRDQLMVVMGLKKYGKLDEEALEKATKAMKKQGSWTEEKEAEMRENYTKARDARFFTRHERAAKKLVEKALRRQYQADGLKLIRTPEGYKNEDGSEPILRDSFKPGSLKTSEERQPKPTGWQPPLATAGGGTEAGVIGPLSGAPPKLGGYTGPTAEMKAQGIATDTTPSSGSRDGTSTVSAAGTWTLTKAMLDDIKKAQAARAAREARPAPEIKTRATEKPPLPKVVEGGEPGGVKRVKKPYQPRPEQEQQPKKVVIGATDAAQDAANAAAEAEWAAATGAKPDPLPQTASVPSATPPAAQTSPEPAAQQQQQQAEPASQAPAMEQQQPQYQAGQQQQQQQMPSTGMGGAPPQQRGFGAPPPQQRGFGAPAAHQQQQQQQQQGQHQPQTRGFGAPPQQRGFGAPPQQQQQQGGYQQQDQQQQQQQGQFQQQQQQQQAPPQQRGFGAPPQQRGFGAPPQQQQQQQGGYQQQGGQQQQQQGNFQQQQQQQQGGGRPQRGFGAPPQRGFGQRPGGQGQGY